MPKYPSRLNRNDGAYRGQTIDIGAVIEDCRQAAVACGWEVASLAAGAIDLPVFQRAGNPGGPRFYLSAGMHGDEPAGPLAVRQLLREDLWPVGANLSIFPCLNPTGFPLNTRESAAGVDLNRQYLQGDSAEPEVRAHLAWLANQDPFEIALCLHEDWEADGFYIYELCRDGAPSRAAAIISAVEQVCPINTRAENDGMPAEGGLMRLPQDPLTRTEWPEAIYLYAHKTPVCCTFETPSDYELSLRVSGQIAAVRAALEGL